APAGSSLVAAHILLLHDACNYISYFASMGVAIHRNLGPVGPCNLYLGTDGVVEFINFNLHYIADLDIPIKRGTFIEFRSGMINVSPIGRNCSQEERDDFEKYDKVHNVRPKMVSVLRKKFAHLNLPFSIGGGGRSVLMMGQNLLLEISRRIQRNSFLWGQNLQDRQAEIQMKQETEVQSC
ncbi:hypothetical protein ZWY2020_058650, partial [Hordeum vulgare]